ncbi:rhomboid 2 [Chlorella sorokiniana]|uniref:Rhomboid 2 n=1 Tax=Chlorella sorokiniana TaxID=3076 RepID=A0A2P6TR60_CHLSO|nr:rhomboid 2 [Chlorella sorokiniana]|eukprot:PRW56550.1 rhomboid 2 [Chlorella sorokiniana]
MADFLAQAQAQPATTVLAVALAALFPALLRRDVGLSYSAVVEHRELWRCFVAQVAHVDLIHLAFNLSALWSIGIVERTQELGTLYYLKTTALLFLLSPAMTLLLYHLLIHMAHKPEYAHTSAVGYSCVLFGWMALLSSPRHPGGITMLPVFGLASVPAWATPWASLVITSLLIPSASFIGHLGGMLAGYLVALGTFQFLSAGWVLGLFGWAALGLGWAAARSRELVPYIRLPSSIAGLGGGGSGSGDVESGGSGSGGGKVRIGANGEILRG